LTSVSLLLTDAPAISELYHPITASGLFQVVGG
ncbi:unnamed protein product, partial [marine sediment metagenome]